MRVAVFSDIHANLPALEAVLGDIDEVGVDERWCLGDVVGYGASPDACVDLARDFDVCLVGNHDLAVLAQLDTTTFSSAARTAVEWTVAHSSDASLDFLRGLTPADTSRPAAMYHASPRDPVWEYVLWPEQAAECLATQERRVSMIGHSHVALFFSTPDPDGGDRKAATEARGWQAGAGTRLEIGEGRWLINPGSVGQPRDGDARAAWLELDTEVWEATYHRVGYDIDRAAKAITDGGLPEHLGRRLYQGR